MCVSSRFTSQVTLYHIRPFTYNCDLRNRCQLARTFRDIVFAWLVGSLTISTSMFSYVKPSQCTVHWSLWHIFEDQRISMTWTVPQRAGFSRAVPSNKRYAHSVLITCSISLGSNSCPTLRTWRPYYPCFLTSKLNGLIILTCRSMKTVNRNLWQTMLSRQRDPRSDSLLPQ
jgi:hypothetical protein